MRNFISLIVLATAFLSLAPKSSAQAMEIFCNVVEVGVHGGNTPDERVVARCASPTAGVSWIAVSTRNQTFSELFFKTALAAFESGRRMYSWAPNQGAGCANNCRLAESAVLLKQ